MSDQIPINPIDTAPELTTIIVLIQPPIPGRMPRLVRTYQSRGEWADIPLYDQEDVAGWISIEDAKKLII